MDDLVGEAVGAVPEPPAMDNVRAKHGGGIKAYVTETALSLAGMVSELEVEFEASLLVPDQPLTVYPESGTAVRLITCPAVYLPVGQPGELAGEAAGSEPEPVWERVSA